MVTLTVTGVGGSDSKSVTIHVTSAAPGAPTANFSANPSSGNAPLTVQFTDQSSGSITARDWDFGDGTSHDSAQNPTHTYNNVGDYTVMLTVTGSGGSDPKRGTIPVTPVSPTASTGKFSSSPASAKAPMQA